MPGKRKNAPRRSASRLDMVRYPLGFNFSAGSGGETSIATISEAFDRTRPFRIAAFHGEFSAYKFPVLVQFEAFSPVSSSDNTWSSPQILVPTGSVRRFRYRIPATNGFWPSETATTQHVFRVFGDCISKGAVGGVLGNVYLTILMRPRELVNTCPAIMSPLSSPHPRAVEYDSPSVSQISEESSSDEYFST